MRTACCAHYRLTVILRPGCPYNWLLCQTLHNNPGTSVSKARPKNLNLTTMRLPLPALVSILHRLSGILLFLILPFLLWMLQDSLASAERFEHLREIVNLGAVKLLLLILVWAFLHHSLAGLRLLAFDVRSQASVTRGRRSSKLVLALSLFLTLLAAIGLW